jgi:hypothetical protein
LATLEQELGRDVPFLGGLCFLERKSRVLEIGAGVLQVVVQKTFIRGGRQVMVVRRITPRPIQADCIAEGVEERGAPAHPSRAMSDAGSVTGYGRGFP